MTTDVTVPLLELKSQYQGIKNEIDEAIRSVVESQWFVLGPEVSGLEQEIASLCQTRHAVGCASGSDAILLALVAFGVGPGDEVICPPYTFFSTAGMIALLGAVPVFADIEPVTYNVDPASVRAAAKRCSRLKAIMPVDLYGQCADMEAFAALGAELGVPIIEDAAQALGSRDAQGHPAGSQCTIGCFSFYPSKNLGGFGDGGMVTTNDADLAERLLKLRLHGETTKYHHEYVGFNSRLDALQAAVLRVKLRHLATWTGTRQANAAFYDKAFAAAGAKTSAVPLDGGGLPLRTPQPAADPASHIYNQYVIRVSRSPASPEVLCVSWRRKGRSARLGGGGLRDAGPADLSRADAAAEGARGGDGERVRRAACGGEGLREVPKGKLRGLRLPLPPGHSPVAQDELGLARESDVA
ncbi:MAG: DegT/DnrJ/EryC1/StrS family aminotransferase [Planctomycetota bacterium]